MYPRSSGAFARLVLGMLASPICQTVKVINSPEFLPDICTLSRPTSMQVANILSIALVFIWSAVSVSCSNRPAPCKKPAVRKEWRAFSASEKAEWIRAVNVCMNTFLTSAHFRSGFGCSACLICLMTRLWPHPLTLRCHLFPPSTHRVPIMMV